MTAVEWLEQEFIKLEATIGVHGKMYELIEQAKEMEKQKDYETKAYWFGRGILAGRENRIAELQPKTYGSKGSDKEEQKKLITEIMNENAKDGLYNTSFQTEIEKLASKHYPEYYSIGLGNDKIGFERGYNLGISSQTEISDIMDIKTENKVFDNTKISNVNFHPHSFVFSLDNKEPIIVINKEGFKYKGELIENGNEVFELFKKFLSNYNSQTEISDEEIEKYANERVVVENVYVRGISAYYLSEGAKWYREQLKQRQ